MASTSSAGRSISVSERPSNAGHIGGPGGRPLNLRLISADIDNHQASACVGASAQPLAVEIEELSTLVKHLADSVATHVFGNPLVAVGAEPGGWARLCSCWRWWHRARQPRRSWGWKTASVVRWAGRSRWHTGQRRRRQVLLRGQPRPASALQPARKDLVQPFYTSPRLAFLVLHRRSHMGPTLRNRLWQWPESALLPSFCAQAHDR